jgi:hypothetical protein
MPVSPADIYGLAKSLAKKDDEVSKRSALSRAYYAIYLFSRDFIEKHQPVYKDIGSHKAVTDALKATKNVHLIAAADRLKQIKVFRHHADYDIHSTLNLRQLDDVFNAYDEIIEQIGLSGLV